MNVFKKKLCRKRQNRFGLATEHKEEMRSTTTIAVGLFVCLLVVSALASTTVNDVYITSYGYNDNGDSSEIAYPNVKHGKAEETNGEYSNPSTFATSSEFAPGTIIYVPKLKKYYIMEDECAECDSDWKKGKHHVDLFIGPDSKSGDSLYDCEDAITESSGTIIVNPASNLAVDTTKIYTDGKCNSSAK